jgi:hypothetical protein
MARLSSFLFFFDFVLGIYFVIVGLNLIDLSFLDSIKNWIIAVGGIFLVISGMFAMRRTSTNY